MNRVFACLIAATFVAVAFAAGPALAQSPDTILFNGKIVTLDAQSTTQEALAVRDGKILAVGSNDDIYTLRGPNTRVVDLAGRTVIPGLIDSHIHAIRAALFYGTEVNWIGAKSIPEAMERIRAAAKAYQPGTWLIVAGGWTPQQFAEKRRPSEAELIAAAPDNPIYVQLFYANALLTPASLKALNINGEADLGPKAKFEKDEAGEPTGWISGDGATITGLFDKLPVPTFEQSVTGTKLFFRELNRLGLTGVSDPGGFNLTAPSYLPLFKVWQDHALTIRVMFSLFAQRPGKEIEDIQVMTQMLPMGFGSDMLRFNGIGENVAWGMYNNDNPSEAQKAQYYQIALWAARRGMTLTQHWNNNKSVGHLLDVFERVNREVPIAPLRWSIGHLNDATPDNLARMKALGVGWLMQNAMFFGGEPFLKDRGVEALRRTPPIMTALKMGLTVGGGTDAHRVMSYNPFVSLEWMVDGKTVAGMPTRGPDETPSREQALRLYTQGSAWFTFDDDKRGTLEPGKLADLAVLSADYLTTPVKEIGKIRSLLTMVGGNVVYASGPFASLAPPR